jgi:hypothetical protein
MTLLNRDDLVRGLRLLVAELRSRGGAASVRIIGGAAMSLRYYDRESTRDIDVATSLSQAELEQIAAKIAASEGWSPDWLNAAAAIFIPSYGTPVEWVTLYEDAGIVIQVAPPAAMLAMKLHANRPGRDDEDLRVLIAICGLASTAELESLFEDFYPGDILSDRALRLAAAILAEGVGDPPMAPVTVELDP